MAELYPKLLGSQLLFAPISENMAVSLLQRSSLPSMTFTITPQSSSSYADMQEGVT